MCSEKARAGRIGDIPGVRDRERTLTLMRRKQVEARTGLPRSTMYAWIAEGNFPEPVSLGPRAVAWLESEIEEWIGSRIQNSRGVQG